MCVYIYRMHVCIFIYIVTMYVCVLVYVHVRGCTRMFMGVYCGVYTCMRVCLCGFMCLVACCSVSDPFGEIRTQLQEARTRFGFVLVVDPIQW